MKRLLIVSLLLCLVLSLVGCGNDGESSTDVSSTPSVAAESSLTPTQMDAKIKAEKYLEITGYSYDVMMEKLQADGVSQEDAKYVVENIIDFDQQASRRAKANLDTMAYSYTGLVSKLVSEKFTQEQAEYAVENCGANWEEQALRKANAYFALGDFPEEQLTDQLSYDGFTIAQVRYALDNVNQ